MVLVNNRRALCSCSRINIKVKIIISRDNVHISPSSLKDDIKLSVYLPSIWQSNHWDYHDQELHYQQISNYITNAHSGSCTLSYHCRFFCNINMITPVRVFKTRLFIQNHNGCILPKSNWNLPWSVMGGL